MAKIFSNFFGQNSYMLELLLAYIPVSVGVLKKGNGNRYFTIKLILGLLILLLISNFTPVFLFQYNINMKVSICYAMVRYLALFSFTVFTFKLVFSINKFLALFCGVSAFSMQHIFYRLKMIVEYYITYFFKNNQVALLINQVSWMILIYGLGFVIYRKTFSNYDEPKVSNKKILMSSLLLIGVSVVLSFLMHVNTFFEIKLMLTPVYTLWSIFSVIIGLLIIIVLFDSITLKNKENEVETIKSLWKRDRRQYEISKQNIEFLNIKFHDLKHFIGDRVKDDALKMEIQQSLDTYDSFLRTNNETLDVILFEKKLSCNSKNIQLNVMAEGEILNIMSPYDIYSLFGNALDNAIESVSKVNDVSKRLINLRVKRRGDMGVILIDNYYEGVISFDNSIPLTTKKNKQAHGFGVKSMMYIAKKYKGDIKVSAENGQFFLTIIIPLIEDKQR